ncbi:hypothetical protein [Pelagicoccus sp. SDUM812005]|uniref:hypothetical protein n=1 Tax=Pelagicoccus sp. SDUM812005 TaxID=3041257 RepID=UPI00280C4432|nr:hypothetical protein [Pelagicoccus sp. SDUM812005]MDQ8182004.1 hypothetical protein [Pelagicoccus sp. SDUM812005]
MKKILSAIIILLGGLASNSNGSELKESSTSLDMVSLRPFLVAVTQHIDSGFGSQQIDKVCDLAKKLRIEKEKTIKFKVTYNSENEPLVVHLYKDDIDVIDVFIFSTEKITKEIDQSMERFFESINQ